jgi:hypothetical protein
MKWWLQKPKNGKMTTKGNKILMKRRKPGESVLHTCFRYSYTKYIIISLQPAHIVVCLMTESKGNNRCWLVKLLFNHFGFRARKARMCISYAIETKQL